MADNTRPLGLFSPIARFWVRLSPRLIPVFAVISAFALGVPLMIISAGEGDIGKGLSISGRAYGALIEGATGLAVNKAGTLDDFATIQEYAATNRDLAASDISRQARPFENVATIGVENLRLYDTFLKEYPALAALDAEAFAETATNLQFARDRFGNVDDLLAAGQTAELLAADAVPNADIRALAALVAGKEKLTSSELLDATALWSRLGQMSGAQYNATLLHLSQIHERGFPAIRDGARTLNFLAEMDIEARSDPADTLLAIHTAGFANVQNGIATLVQLDAAGVSNPAALNTDFRRIASLYNGGYLRSTSINNALQDELPPLLQENLVILRPGTRVLIDAGAGRAVFGSVQDDQGLPVLYLRVANYALLFIPAQLESTLVRAIPFIIAGLAVALGFKAGLFNIGAQGQMYAGAIVAAWAGFALDLPSIIHIPLVIVVGTLGGFVWGAIPGALKAFTGAHEVIVTIMLNFVAIRTVDWLIKSTDPVLLGDLAATNPRTPNLVDSARMPSFDDYSIFFYVVLGLALFLLMTAFLTSMAMRRSGNERVNLNPVLERAFIMGMAVIIGGILLRGLAVTGTLHLGFVLMLFAVWFVDWFLERTTPGFELRTVGTNPHAARYAGMSVPRNIMLAMAISGALAGFAGMIEISGVQHNMKPDFFAKAGFDAIAVALIARSNPRSMIWAGLLWGGLLSGAGLMQIRANIASDLVAILQACIIMFISADQIIRFLWRVPEPSEEEKFQFSITWGGQ